MNAYMCTVCGFLYDDESSEKSRESFPIPFEELDESWVCPVCGVRPDYFTLTESDRTPDLAAEGEEES